MATTGQISTTLELSQLYPPSRWRITRRSLGWLVSLGIVVIAISLLDQSGALKRGGVGSNYFFYTTGVFLTVLTLTIGKIIYEWSSFVLTDYYVSDGDLVCTTGVFNADTKRIPIGSITKIRIQHNGIDDLFNLRNLEFVVGTKGIVGAEIKGLTPIAMGQLHQQLLTAAKVQNESVQNETAQNDSISEQGAIDVDSEEAGNVNTEKTSTQNASAQLSDNGDEMEINNMAGNLNEDTEPRKAIERVRSEKEALEKQNQKKREELEELKQKEQQQEELQAAEEEKKHASEELKGTEDELHKAREKQVEEDRVNEAKKKLAKARHELQLVREQKQIESELEKTEKELQKEKEEIENERQYIPSRSQSIQLSSSKG